VIGLTGDDHDETALPVHRLEGRRWGFIADEVDGVDERDVRESAAIRGRPNGQDLRVARETPALKVT
jgi:hypothetical protein